MFASFFPALMRGQRSTVLNTLGWMMLLLIAGLLGSLSINPDSWAPIFFAVMAAIDFAAFIVFYIYFALTNSDALRSENFSIQKMAIERGLIGDSSSGLFEVEETIKPEQLSDDPAKQIEHKP